jgi:hypothetical protein
VALVHTSLVAATPVTVAVMVVLQLPVVLVVVLVDTLALVGIPLPTAMAMLAAAVLEALAAVIVLHTAIPVEGVLVLLDKALLDQVLATWAATEAVVAKTAERAKIRIIAVAFKTGQEAYTVAVQVVLVTIPTMVMEYKLEDAGALELFGEQEEASHQQVQEICNVTIINGKCFV